MPPILRATHGGGFSALLNALMDCCYLHKMVRKRPIVIGSSCLRWIVFCIIGLMSTYSLSTSVSQAADIAFPMVEPRLPISISAQAASKSVRGGYDVYELKGDCRVEQGSFVATGDAIQIWINHFDASLFDESSAPDVESKQSSRAMFKVILRIDGNAKAQWGKDESIQDVTWTGRLYSYRAPDIDAPRGQPNATMYIRVLTCWIANGIFRRK